MLNEFAGIRKVSDESLGRDETSRHTYGGLSGSKFSFAFLQFDFVIMLFCCLTARYGFHVRYYVFQIRHFMITNCNGPFQFSLLLLYFVFLLRYLITNCFFCSVSYPLLPLCNSIEQLRCSFMMLRCSFMLLHCSHVLLRCLFMLLRCSYMLLRCSFMLLRCSFMLLRCSDVLLRCSFMLLRCSDVLLRCSFMLLRCSDVLLRCSFMLLRCSDVLFPARF